ARLGRIHQTTVIPTPRLPLMLVSGKLPVSVCVAFALSFIGLLALAHASTDDKPAPATVPPQLELRPGDHISIIDNTLAERMQHDGCLEKFFHSRFPKHDLTLRNLGFSGDELTVRLRSAGCGSPDEWLTRTKADVVFAFFGYNESFGGEAGLPKFKKDLDEFVKHALAQEYNGKSAPRLVLFAPIAHEERKEPNWPPGAENNQRIELYTKAMADVAAANKVPFVNLYAPTKAAYAKAAKPLTINGIHLTASGNELVAAAIDRAL